MKKIFNILFLILKWILMFISFALTFFIVLSMYDRLNKNIIESYTIFVPYVLLLIFFLTNHFSKQKRVTNNIFYNLTCCLSFIVIIFVCVRSLFDSNMLMNQIMGYKINFCFFNNFLIYMKIILYGLSLSNIFFIINFKEQKKKESVEVL